MLVKGSVVGLLYRFINDIMVQLNKNNASVTVVYTLSYNLLNILFLVLKKSVIIAIIFVIYIASTSFF